MKTAVSLPDSLFAEGEKLAKKLKITRSDLYQEALANYLEYHNDKQLLERLNQVYANNESKLDQAFTASQHRRFPAGEWS